MRASSRLSAQASDLSCFPTMSWGWGSGWEEKKGWEVQEGWGHERCAHEHTQGEGQEGWNVTGNGTWWGQNRESEEKGDKYKNVTTFGCVGRKPLPLEDRKDVLLALVPELVPRATLSKMAVAAWTAELTMAAFWVLTHTAPKTPLRWLKDDEGNFSVEHAVKVLKCAALSRCSNEEDLKELVDFVTEHSWNGSDKIMQRAVEQGFDPAECLDQKQQAFIQALTQCGTGPVMGLFPSRWDSRSGGQPGPQAQFGQQASSTRKLVRSETEEECERLQRRKKMMTLQLEVREQQHELALKGHLTDPGSQAHAAFPPGITIFQVGQLHWVGLNLDSSRVSCRLPSSQQPQWYLRPAEAEAQEFQAHRAREPGLLCQT